MAAVAQFATSLPYFIAHGKKSLYTAHRALQAKYGFSNIKMSGGPKFQKPRLCGEVGLIGLYDIAFRIYGGSRLGM
jgi:hypothetical protein